MKTHTGFLIGLTALWVTSALGQQPNTLPAPFSPGVAAPPSATATGLTKFNLDFPGGTPKELVAAIEKAMGKPLNAIVPEEFADTPLPALKLNNVDVSHLFQALGTASRTSHMSPGGGYQSFYGFSTEGVPTDDSVWSFYGANLKPHPPTPPAPERICRFYSLAPYLERGLTVDDITTAIETGWKMLGDSPKPTINFHKDTKLLIAVGEPSKLETIDAVLKALQPPPAAKPAEKPKAEK